MKHSLQDINCKFTANVQDILYFSQANLFKYTRCLLSRGINFDDNNAQLEYWRYKIRIHSCLKNILQIFYHKKLSKNFSRGILGAENLICHFLRSNVIFLEYPFSG